MNNLGIYSGGFPQGPIRPGVLLHRPLTRVIQVAGHNDCDQPNTFTITGTII